MRDPLAPAENFIGQVTPASAGREPDPPSSGTLARSSTWLLTLGIPVAAMYGAQYLTGALPQSRGWGIALMALSLLLLVLRLRATAATVSLLTDTLQMCLGLLFILPLALDVDHWKVLVPPWQLLGVWALGCSLVILAVLRRQERPIALGLPCEPWTRLDWLILLALLVGATLLRVPGIETIPMGVDPDEGSFALSALDMATGAARDPFGTGWVTHPTLQFYLNGQLVKLLGRTFLAMRLPSAIMGVLAVLAVYLLGRVTFGRRVGLVAGALALGSDAAIHFSRLGVNNISDMLFMAWTLAALWFAGASGRPWGYAAAGLGLGLAQYYYFGSRAIPCVVLVTVLLWVIADPRGVWRARYLLLGGGLVALAVTGPLIGHWLRFPNSITEHLGLTMPFSDLARVRAEQMQLSTAGLWWQQIRDSLLVLTVLPDRGSFYHPPQALLHPLLAPLFLLGLVTLAAGWRRPVNQGLLAWLAIDLLLGSVLMADAAAFHRLLGILPAALLVVAIGLDAAISTVARLGGWRTAQTRTMLGAATAVLVIVTAGYYFWVFTPHVPFKPPHQEAATIAALEYERLGGRGQFVLVAKDGVDAAGKVYQTPIAFVAGPAFVGGTPLVLQQLAGGGQGENLAAAATQADGRLAARVPAARPLYFYIFPDRIAELPDLMARFPGGQVTEYRRPTDNVLFLTRYLVP